jgi:hypothetical protein
VRLALQAFDQIVLARLSELLKQHRDQLPVEFVFAGMSRPYSDAPVIIFLDPTRKADPVNCEGVFGEINRKLNEDFVKHDCYFGLTVAVPHEYLNQTRLLRERAQQQLDNERYRSIRIEETENGRNRLRSRQ